MDFAPLYLLQRFFYRFVDFFHHWYIDGSRWLGHHYVAALEAMDHVLAIRITLRYFFQPLYRDYSIIGRILGVIFRTLRILVGGVVYLCFGIVCALIYVAWVLAPIVIIFNAIRYF